MFVARATQVFEVEFSMPPGEHGRMQIGVPQSVGMVGPRAIGTKDLLEMDSDGRSQSPVRGRGYRSGIGENQRGVSGSCREGGQRGGHQKGTLAGKYGDPSLAPVCANGRGRAHRSADWTRIRRARAPNGRSLGYRMRIHEMRKKCTCLYG